MSPNPTVAASVPTAGAAQSQPGRTAASATSAALAEEAAVSSQQLLNGRRTLTIAHNGALYRLQATRQGKLILTK